jgi:very-short-patch-repair endonuclease
VQLRLLEPFAERHHGLVTLDAARRAGVGDAAWYRALRADLLEALYPKVARLVGTPRTLQQRALAAVWGIGEGAIASHRTGMALWGVDRPADDPIDVVLESRRRFVQRSDVIVHRPRDLVDLRPVLRDRIPVTNPVRALLDLGAVDPDGVYPAAVHVLSTRLASPAALRAGLMRHARRGRNGITAYRSMLDMLETDGRPVDSELESQMTQLLRQHDLPPAIFHARVAGYEVDFLVRDSTVVLECDGWESHGLDRNQFEYDRARAADITGAGFVIVHFTWRQVTEAPAAVVRRIRTNLQQWAPHLLR